jgi:hypothetical protein
MKNLHISFGLLSTLVLAAFSSTAQADMYDITYTDGGANVANGVIDVVGDSAVSGSLTVTAGSASGSWTLSPGSGSDGSFIWDNEVFPGSDPFLDGDGLLFVDDGSELNMWGNSPSNYSFYGNIDGNYSPISDGGTATLTLVSQGNSVSAASAPDGAWTAVLLGGALAGLEAFRRKLASLNFPAGTEI